MTSAAGNGGSMPNGSAGQSTLAGAAGMANTGGADGRAGSGGVGGSTGVSGSGSVLANTYDGVRASTVSFDLGWKFHLGDASGAQQEAFDDSSWTGIDVPHDWSISLPFDQSSPASFGGGYLNGGIGWYRKSFEVPGPSMGKRVFLQFDGVYMDSTVWLNGAQVCARPYGYSSFECDVTSKLAVGSPNVVAVKVNNTLPSSRWYSGSGIYRHVWLKVVDPVRVAYTGTSVTTPEVSASSASVKLGITLQNDGTTAASVVVASSLRKPPAAEASDAISVLSRT